jgi:hypothetical protein
MKHDLYKFQLNFDHVQVQLHLRLIHLLNEHQLLVVLELDIDEYHKQHLFKALNKKIINEFLC